jgi:hypothetical protein
VGQGGQIGPDRDKLYFFHRFLVTDRKSSDSMRCPPAPDKAG